jgi:hypothetical protein
LSDAAPLASTTPPAARLEVRSAIARASAATGIDFGYLLGQARLESSLNPNAKAGTSSAAGLYQFTKGTWLTTLDRHGASHGYGWAGAAIERGKVADPGKRSQVLALRYDPDASALMAAELASDNRDVLVGVLGREPDATELYLAHFLGAGGASKFLTALQSDPGQSAAALFPQAAEANRGIFYGPGGAPRSLGEVMGLMRGKMARAMGDDLSPSPSGEGLGWGVSYNPRVAYSDRPHPNPSPEGEGLKQRPSMAETLSAAFGGSAAMPGHVRSAYGKMKAFGL